ncbi:MAG: MFS transporter [SAR86 cluster bacterium]|jgi:glycoside/pentoside/hexuronide:cation symporter, GPH family|tara:strand:+ start:102 stop:1577 length:1476 start_codon:yes stop_codon:yes gene_type:complete
MSESKENSSAVLSKSTLYAHGSIGIPLAVIGYPLAIWIPAHYAGGLGMSLAMVGTILMLARFTDVLTDPIMGEISDRWRTRFGRRKPWLLVGMPIMMLGVYKLFIPPADVGIWYFLIYLTLFFVGSTIIALPHRAWGAELSTDYHQRSRVTASREFFVLGGLMLAALVPMLVEVTADGSGSVGQVFTIIWQDAVGAFTGDLADKEIVNRSTLTGPVLAGLAWTIILVLPVCVFVVLAFVKEPPPTKKDTVPLKEGLRYLWKNGPMRRVLIIALLVVFGEAFRNAVSLFFIRDIIGIPTIGAAYFFYFIAGLGAIPFWLWLGRKIGKHRAFMCTLITISIVSFANLFLSYGDYLAFFLLFIVKGFCFGGLQFLPVAMLADVVDVDTARSGGRRAGTYFAILGLTEKLAVALGTGFSLNLVGLLGFDPSGGVAASTEIGVLSLRLVYCCGPIFFFGLAMLFIWSYPLTPARHARLRQRIERRNARLAAIETPD